jgi:sugar-specific transcriptional regulator TrmB
MLDFLRKLGLNKYEAESYLALLRLGPSGAYNISKEGNVPFGRVYDSLNNLELKGLVEIIPSKPKKYKPVEPLTALNGLIDEEFNNLEKLRHKVKEKVNSIVRKKEASDIVSISKGRVNFAKSLNEHFGYERELWTTSESFTLEKTYPAIKRYSKNKMINEFVLIDKDKTNMERLKELKKQGLRFKHYPLHNVRFVVSDESFVTISVKNEDDWTNINVKNKDFGKALTKLLKTAWEQSLK